MKINPLLVYAYVLPYIGSIVWAILPAVLPFISYENVASFYSGNLAICLALLAVAGGVSFPFQTKILHEDNLHVLDVLQKGHVREVFQKASVIQAVTILLLSLVLIILSTIRRYPDLIGFIELFASCLMVFESLALVSNGIAYGKIREKIIVAANKALNRTGGPQSGPPAG